jgi:hypothetical protein
MINLQEITLKIRAFIAGESNTERIIRDKVEDVYKNKRAPKVKKN